MISSQKPFRGMQINRTHPLEKGLVGCWIFNELTGSTVFDLSGNNNPGTINGADWVPEGLDFVRANTDTVNTSLLINPQNSYTAVFKTSWTTISQSLSGCRIAGGDRFYIGTDDACTYFGAGNAFHSGGHSILHGMVAKTPYLMTLTIDGSTARYFVNNIQKDSFSYSASGIISNALVIGDLGGPLGYPTNANIEFFYIYNRVLSASEVAWLNREPYVFFERPVNPAIMYYESVGGVTIPVFAHYYNQMRS